MGDESLADFEIWLRQECFKEPPEHCKQLARAAWNYQVNTIEALQAADAQWEIGRARASTRISELQQERDTADRLHDTAIGVLVEELTTTKQERDELKADVEVLRVLAMSDEEIRADFIARGEDPDLAVDDIRKIVGKAIAEHEAKR